MNKNRGFTLLELMIVIAIMGVLATLAIPTYHDRIIRTQVSEGLQLADFAREGVAQYFKANKRMPRNNTEAGLPPADKIIGNHVTGVEVVDGAIHISFGHRVNRYAAGKVLSLRPAAVPAYPQVPLAWSCGPVEPPSGMKSFGTNKTSMPAQYLPVDCRG